MIHSRVPFNANLGTGGREGIRYGAHAHLPRVVIVKHAIHFHVMHGCSPLAETPSTLRVSSCSCSSQKHTRAHIFVIVLPAIVLVQEHGYMLTAMRSAPLTHTCTHNTSPTRPHNTPHIPYMHIMISERISPISMGRNWSVCACARVQYSGGNTAHSVETMSTRACSLLDAMQHPFYYYYS